MHAGPSPQWLRSPTEWASQRGHDAGLPEASRELRRRQRPCGTASTRRLPDGSGRSARPCYRGAVSSRNTNRARSVKHSQVRRRWRSPAVAGRSCSVEARCRHTDSDLLLDGGELLAPLVALRLADLMARRQLADRPGISAPRAPSAPSTRASLAVASWRSSRCPTALPTFLAQAPAKRGEDTRRGAAPFDRTGGIA